MLIPAEKIESTTTASRTHIEDTKKSASIA